MINLENIINCKAISLGQYFNLNSSSNYQIPFSQREYEWGEEEVTRMFNDFISLYENINSNHILNFFTLSNEGKRLKIYDGQQRSITCIIFFGIISQKLNKIGLKEVAEQVQRDFIKRTDNLHDGIITKKIIFDKDETTDFLYKITDINYSYEDSGDEVKLLPKNSSKKYILKNYLSLSNKLDNYFQRVMLNDNSELIYLLNSVLERCLLVVFQTSDERMAKDMFESINNTGKLLKKYNVLKNDMVRTLGEDYVRPYWDKIEQNILNLDQNEFLKTFSTMINGKTTLDKMLLSIYKKYNPYNEEEMKSLLKLLVDASKNFKMIFYNNNNKLYKKFYEFNIYLYNFGIKQHYPILMGLLLKKTKINTINDFLWSVIVFGVRNLHFNEQRANKVEILFANMAKELYEDKITIDDIIIKIKDITYDDNKTKKAIKEFSNKNDKFDRTLLMILYNNNLSELQINESSVDLEHVLPKRVDNGSKWKKTFPNEDQRNKYKFMIGNEFLWNLNDNRSSKNADFEIKKEKYKDSSIKDLRDISKKRDWKMSDIDKRTSKLSEIIVNVFNIK